MASKAEYSMTEATQILGLKSTSIYRIVKRLGVDLIEKPWGSRRRTFLSEEAFNKICAELKRETKAEKSSLSADFLRRPIIAEGKR